MRLSGYEVYLTAWLVVSAVGVIWRALKGDTTGLAHLIRDGLFAAGIVGFIEVLRLVVRRHREGKR